MKADKISKKLKHSQPDLARKFLEQGCQELYSGNFEDALSNFKKGLKIQPRNAELWAVYGNLLSRSTTNHEEAIACFDKALKINPNSLSALASRGITLCDHLDRYEEAIASFNKALEVTPDSDVTPGYYDEVWHNRGVALKNLGRFEEAIASFDKALEINPGCHTTYINRGTAVLASPVYSKFSVFFVEATLSQRNPQLNQRGYLGQVITLEFGLTQVTPHSESWGGLHLGLGEAHFRQGKLEQQSGHNPTPYWQKARHCLDLALSVLSTEAFPELRLETLQLMIRVLLAQGDHTIARDHRKDGVKSLQTLLNQAPTVFQKQQLEAKFSGFSQIEVDVWLQSGELITALETAERYKNRCLTWILEAWKEPVISPKWADMQTLCTPDTAIIYWHLSPDSLITFILTNKSNSPDDLKCDRASQAQQLNTWMKDWNEDYRDYASKKLTETEKENHPWRENIVSLLEDLRQKILQIDTICQQIPDTVQNLILVPHRDLHLLPIHTLFHDYCCTYLPSAKIGLTLHERPSQNKTYTPLLSVEDPATEQPSMPFAQLESAIIRHLVKNATCVSSNNASSDNVLKSLQKSFATFHFTGHGAYNSRNPADSALALTDGLLTAKDISQLDLSSYKLIVLAACETALTGNDDIKTEYVGLSSAFLNAGAANVLSTLWPVNEVASCWFSIYFYQQLLQNQPPALSLHNTQKWLKTVTIAHLIQWIEKLSHLENLGYRWQKELKHEIQNLKEEEGRLDTDQPYAHPFYWAAFTLTGRGNL